MSNGKNTEALEVLKTAVVTDPKNGQAWYNLALLYNEINDRINALAAFEKAVQFDDDNPRLYYNYGLFLQQSGNINKGYYCFGKRIEIEARMMKK
jgi:Tfp pilus assembly protein PilF